MSTPVTAAIVMANTLQAIGLRHLLADSLGVNAMVGDIDDIAERADAFDFLFTDAEHFAAHLTFFLPRRSRVIIVTTQPHTDVDLIDAHAPEDDIVQALSHRLDRSAQPADTSGTLSQREVDVLRLVAAGHINKEIADRLGISINTVLTHRKNITAKLGIKSVSGLTFYAMMNGLIAPR